MRIRNKSNIASEVFDDLINNNVELSYFGSLDFGISNQLITHLKKKLERIGLNKKQFNRIYISFTEGIDNAQKHQKVVREDSPGIVICSIQNNAFNICLGNVIQSQDRLALSKTIDQLSALSKSELTDLIRKRLTNGDIANDQSAHIGLAKIALNSDQNFFYSFKELDSGELLLILNIFIDLAHATD